MIFNADELKLYQKKNYKEIIWDKILIIMNTQVS